MMSAEKQEKIALFRFGVIAPLMGLKKHERGAGEQMIRQITKRQWEIPYVGSHINPTRGAIFFSHSSKPTL